MNNYMTPLLAAGWGELIVLIIFMGISALGQFLSSKAKPQKPPRRRQAQPPLGKPGQQPPPPRNLEQDLRTEVDQFLRQMRGEAPRSQPPQPPRPVAVKLEEQPPRPSRRRSRAASTRRTQQTSQPLAQAHSLREESVQEHVSRHISTADIARHTATLGQEVGLADEKLESHLEEKFQHRLGSLEHMETKLQQRGPSAAEELVRLLRSPTGMRQVVLASEILRRPEI